MIEKVIRSTPRINSEHSSNARHRNDKLGVRPVAKNPREDNTTTVTLSGSLNEILGSDRGAPTKSALSVGARRETRPQDGYLLSMEKRGAFAQISPPRSPDRHAGWLKRKKWLNYGMISV